MIEQCIFLVDIWSADYASLIERYFLVGIWSADYAILIEQGIFGGHLVS